MYCDVEKDEKTNNKQRQKKKKKKKGKVGRNKISGMNFFVIILLLQFFGPILLKKNRPSILSLVLGISFVAVPLLFVTLTRTPTLFQKLSILDTVNFQKFESDIRKYVRDNPQDLHMIKLKEKITSVEMLRLYEVIGDDAFHCDYCKQETDYIIYHLSNVILFIALATFFFSIATSFDKYSSIRSPILASLFALSIIEVWTCFTKQNILPIQEYIPSGTTAQDMQFTPQKMKDFRLIDFGRNMLF